MDLKVGENFAIVAVTVPEGLDVTYVPDDSGVVSVDSDGVVTALKEGTASIIVKVGDGKVYVENSTTVVVTVKSKETPKEDLNVSVVVDPITAGEDAVIKVSGLADATGNITADVNGKTYTVPINDGEATITVPGLTENATVVVSYPGDDKYNNFTESVAVTVNPKSNATIDINVTPVTEGQNTTIDVTLPKDATGNVSATVNGKTYIDPVKNGKAKIVIPDLPVGNYTAIVNYSGDNKYNPAEATVNIVVEDGEGYKINASDVVKYYMGPERLNITVCDLNDNPVANETVQITINGVTYTKTTDKNGFASLAIRLEAGNYVANVKLNNTIVNASVTVLTTANGTNLVKMCRNATQYTAVFYDSDGNYLKKGTQVKFNINGIIYNREVGDKGLVKLNINLDSGEYIITNYNLVTGEENANNITVLSTIVENNDLTKYYKNASQYTVKIIKLDGKVAGSGETVTFNINGVFYNRTTDANGIATLNINLDAGDYIITADYKGCLVSNKIKVLPVLTAKDLVKKYGTPDQFTATLVDGQGRAFAGETIIFNVNGVFYSRVTDGEGQAKLNITLIPGQYIITSMYENGASIGNTIKVTQ